MEQCPPNTHSVSGSSSILECVCDDGFDCSYTNSVKGKVVLPVAPEDFDSVMQANFVQAIAEAAGKLVFYLCRNKVLPWLMGVGWQVWILQE